MKVDEEHLATLYLGLLLQEGKRTINTALLCFILILRELSFLIIAKVNIVQYTKTNLPLKVFRKRGNRSCPDGSHNMLLCYV